MSRRRKDPKEGHLRKCGALNPRPGSVTDPLFAADEAEFFDPRDIVQVKYEMLRRAQAEGMPVSHCAASFGFSRPSFYAAQEALGNEGLPGLVPKKRGPRQGHKLGEKVLDYVDGERREEPSVSLGCLVERIKERFGIKVHSRSLQRALNRRGKKR